MPDHTQWVKFGEALGVFKTSVTFCQTLLCIGVDKATEAANAIFPKEISVLGRDVTLYLVATPSDDLGRLNLQVTCNNANVLNAVYTRLAVDYNANDLTEGVYDPQKGNCGLTCWILLPLTPESYAYHNMRQALKAASRS